MFRLPLCCSASHLPGSEIAFFKNGVCQGTAFTDLTAARYFPAASLYTLPSQTEGATVRFNFGPDFAFPLPDWGARPVPGALCDAPPVPKPRFIDEPEDRGDIFCNNSNKNHNDSNDHGGNGESRVEDTCEEGLGGEGAGLVVMSEVGLGGKSDENKGEGVGEDDKAGK